MTSRTFLRCCRSLALILTLTSSVLTAGDDQDSNSNNANWIALPNEMAAPGESKSGNPEIVPRGTADSQSAIDQVANHEFLIPESDASAETDEAAEKMLTSESSATIPEEFESVTLPIKEIVISDELISETVISETEVTEPEVLDVSENDNDDPKFGDWTGYDASQGSTTWINGENFSLFSLETFPTLELGKNSALMLGSGIHFLDGPKAPDMPPRLFDLHLAYQIRKQFSPQTMVDIKLGFGVFSDFNASSRDGVRFPGHIVSYRQIRPRLVSVLGVDFLDRDDISALPVAGLVWQPHSDLILECVFPRPKVQLKVDDDSALYLSGELGGDTWSIRRADLTSDTATYRDFRLTAGILDFSGDSDSTTEIGWAFNRSLEYRSANGNTDLGGAFIWRWTAHF